jgi:hypothetical protein
MSTQRGECGIDRTQVVVTYILAPSGVYKRCHRVGNGFRCRCGIASQEVLPGLESLVRSRLGLGVFYFTVVVLEPIEGVVSYGVEVQRVLKRIGQYGEGMVIGTQDKESPVGDIEDVEVFEPRSFGSLTK